MKKNESENFDAIVIGGGAAGMSAALWCDELGLKTILLEAADRLGGQLHRVYNPIENHLGAHAASGEALNEIFAKQIEKRGFKIHLGAAVERADLKTKTVYLPDKRIFAARALVIATGVSRRKLGVPGEAEFAAKGILESGKRDAEKVRGKTVAIIGGGDAALENALILAETAAKVYLIHRRRNFRARSEFIEKVSQTENVESLTETLIVEILGTETLEAVRLKKTLAAESFVLPVDRLLARIGVAPNTEIFHKKLKLDADGYIAVNANCETNVESVYAIGDVASPISPTISTAVGTGATVAKVIFGKLNKVR